MLAAHPQVPRVSSPRTAMHADIPATSTCGLGLLDPALPVKVGRWKSLGIHIPSGGPLARLPCPWLRHFEVWLILWIVPKLPTFFLPAEDSDTNPCACPPFPLPCSFLLGTLPSKSLLQDVSSQKLILGNSDWHRGKETVLETSSFPPFSVFQVEGSQPGIGGRISGLSKWNSVILSNAGQSCFTGTASPKQTGIFTTKNSTRQTFRMQLRWLCRLIWLTYWF